MSGQSDLSLPPKLPFPVKVVKRLVRAGDKVERGTPLLTYSFNYKSPDHKEETLYGTWESHVEGSVDMWIVDEGEIVGKEYGPVIVVTEPCKHGLQIGGLCALCGKDMTLWAIQHFYIESTDFHCFIVWIISRPQILSVLVFKWITVGVVHYFLERRQCVLSDRAAKTY